MKIYISVDAEGIAGISDWQQIRTTGDDFALGRRLMLGEVNAAIDGILAVDPAAQIVVNDAHGTMRNLPPDELHGEAEYLSGAHKPLYMMEGLDESFSAILFIGYHGSVGGHPAILSHTYNPRAIGEVKLGNRPVGESALNGLVAAHYRVPIALVSGDDVTAKEMRALLPEVEAVVVKQSYGRFAARSLHPAAARRTVQLGVQRALGTLPNPKLVPSYAPHVPFFVTFLTADMAQACLALHHVKADEKDPRTVLIGSDDPLDVFKAFVAMILITRSLVD